MKLGPYQIKLEMVVPPNRPSGGGGGVGRQSIHKNKVFFNLQWADWILMKFDINKDIAYQSSFQIPTVSHDIEGSWREKPKILENA